MEQENIIKNVIKKYVKKVLIVAIIFSFIIVSIGAIFWGTVKETVRNVSNEFNDVIDNVIINGNNIEIDQEYLAEAKKRLKKLGIEEDTLGLGGHEEYLERFLEAEIVTNFPYLGGDELQGTVYFERAKIDGSTVQLEYKPYDEFYSMKNSKNGDAFKYFTVDEEDWTVHVVRNQSENNFEIEKINYKDMVSKFSMPFEFPISLAMTTQNPQFALAVVNLVKDSKIVITIAESKTTTITDTKYTYLSTVTTKDKLTGEVLLENSARGEQNNQDIEETYSTSVFLSRANTWILNEITELNYEDTGNVAGEPTIKELEDDSFSYDGGDYITTTKITEKKEEITITTRHQRWNRGTTKVIEKTSNFTNLILRDSFIDGSGIVEVAKQCHNYLAEKKYTYLLGAGHDSNFPDSIINGSQIDCSAYVSWVLYEVGYTDMECQASYTLEDFANARGWEVIESIDELQPGDILIFDGHTNILAYIENGNYYCYDCGWTGAIQAKDPIEYNVKGRGFECGLRPNDEIAKALAPKTIKDLKESVQNYIDTLENGKYQVSVENLDKNTNNSFTIGSEKVKSEGWLKLFIMATAYDEINKGNINEEDISADIERMITTDSNEAANMILNKLGKEDLAKGIDTVKKYLRKNSYGTTNIEEQLAEVTPAPGSDKNYTTTSNVNKLLENIFEGKCVNNEYSDKMLQLLKGQLLIEYIPSIINNGEVANKTGEQTDILQDAAIVSLENANYLLTISVSDVTNKDDAANHIREITKIVNVYFTEYGTVRNNNSNFMEDEEIDYILNGKRVCYKVPSAGYQCPLDNLVEESKMLFTLLAASEKTQSHENLMRYLLYLLTGDNYGVTEFDFEEFLNGSFFGTGGAWSAIWGNACTKEEFIAAVKAYKPPNTTGNGGRSCVECYNKYFVANAENFYDICTKNGMDPRFIFCIGLHESYFGTSNIANTKGNFFGWGAVDWDPMGGAHSFADMSEGIEEVSSGLKNYVTPGTWQYKRIEENGYDPTTIDGIGSLYASDPNWATAVKKHMTNVFGCTGDVAGNEMQKKIVQLATSGDMYGNKGGYCQAWVADVYMHAGQSRTSSCCASTAADKWVISKDKNNIPLGACVYGHSYNYVAQCGGREAGHVGIYVGDGKVASNVGYVKIESLSSWTSTYGWKGWGWNGGTDYSK